MNTLNHIISNFLLAGVYFTYLYSVCVGIHAVVSIDKRRNQARAASMLVTLVGMVYILEGIVRFLHGDEMIINPLASVIDVLNVAVNIVALKIFACRPECDLPRSELQINISQGQQIQGQR